MFFKMGVFKNFTIFKGKYLCWSVILLQYQAFTPAFSCEIWESLKKIYFEKHLRTIASVVLINLATPALEIPYPVSSCPLPNALICSALCSTPDALPRIVSYEEENTYTK